MKKPTLITVILLSACLSVSSQTKEAFTSGESKTGSTSLLDPSRFSIHHAMSFGMGTSSGSSLKTQSLYSTMIQYKFAAPVTLNLNFGLPLYNNFSPKSNLTATNIQSTEYFQSMPCDISLSWKPRDNMMVQFSVARRTMADYYSPLSSPYPDLFGDGLYRSFMSGK